MLVQMINYDIYTETNTNSNVGDPEWLEPRGVYGDKVVERILERTLEDL